MDRNEVQVELKRINDKVKNRCNENEKFEKDVDARLVKITGTKRSRETKIKTTSIDEKVDDLVQTNGTRVTRTLRKRCNETPMEKKVNDL